MSPLGDDGMLTIEQRNHLNQTVTYALKRMYDKYEIGAEEHGGNLWDHSMMWFLDQVIAEAVDTLVYAITAKQKLMGEKPDGTIPPWVTGNIA
jgi:hypothetical protein